MFTAQKGNKVLKIESAEVKQYRALGFDIYEGDKLLHHGHGKTVPYAKYEELKAELEQAKAELELARFELESVKAELDKALKSKPEAKAKKK
ncbi:MAG: hypothetical protein GX337_09870 [Christensenellaceae bacterium]|nr:hypothetical protein [Christensenellaceae bacterium]